jgi:hypothetical protein
VVRVRKRSQLKHALRAKKMKLKPIILKQNLSNQLLMSLLFLTMKQQQYMTMLLMTLTLQKILLMALTLQYSQKGRNSYLSNWIVVRLLTSLTKYTEETTKWNLHLKVSQIKLQIKDGSYPPIYLNVNIKNVKTVSLIYFNYQKVKRKNVIVDFFLCFFCLQF